MSHITGLEVVYCDENGFKEHAWQDNVLGVIQYGLHDNIQNESEYLPKMFVKTSVVGAPEYYELWLIDKKVTYSRSGNFVIGFDNENLFGCCSYSTSCDLSLSELAESIYDEALTLTTKHNYPYLYRAWNYIPNISEKDCSGDTRYEAFNLGRHCAFDKKHKEGTIFKYPASTAVGSISNNMCMCFLSSAKKKYVPIENPRQIAAYNYRPQYGIRPPVFSRAVYIEHDNSDFSIFVSGTASIVRSESVYPANIEKQCNETLYNIRALISEENLHKHGIHQSCTLSDIRTLKVYLKDKKDAPIVRVILEEKLSTNIQTAYVQADLCRSDLLVEIEGILSGKS